MKHLLLLILFAVSTIAAPHVIRKKHQFGIACDPLNDIYHEVECSATGRVTTGLPVLVFGATKAEVRDQLFSAWTEDTDGNLVTYTAREVTLSVDYTEEDAKQTAANAVEITDGLLVRSVKHPDREEWAMIVSVHILQGAKAGPKKDALLLAHSEKVGNGKNKTKDQARDDNWHKRKPPGE